VKDLVDGLGGEHPAAVRPLDKQRHIQLPEPFTQPLLKLLLAYWGDTGRLIHRRCLLGGEERQRLARVIENQVVG